MNAVAPGVIDTRLTRPKERGAAIGIPAELREQLIANVPMGRAGSAEEWQPCMRSWSPPTPTTSPASRSPSPEASADLDHYEQEGEGPDIVWVSRAGGTADLWGYQLPNFRTSFRDTTFDTRGVGTTRTDAPQPWPIEDFATDVADLIREVRAITEDGERLRSFILDPARDYQARSRDER